MPTKTYVDNADEVPDYADVEHGKRGGLFYWANRQPGKQRETTHRQGKSMAFEHVQEKLANLPNWAKIGLIGIAAILTYLIIKHRKTGTTSTGITDATGAAGGIYNVEIPPSGVLGGTSGGGSSDTTTPPTTPPTTTTPPVTVPPATTPIVFGGTPPSVPAPIPQTITPMSNYITRQPIPISVQPPETSQSVFESITHGLSPQPINQGIQGTNTMPPYRR